MVDRAAGLGQGTDRSTRLVVGSTGAALRSALSTAGRLAQSLVPARVRRVHVERSRDHEPPAPDPVVSVLRVEFMGTGREPLKEPSGFIWDDQREIFAHLQLELACERADLNAD